jgi:hypothetical protein
VRLTGSPVSTTAAFARGASILVLALGAFGCAARPEPRFVKASELGTGGPLAPGQALVVEFQAGDTIPLRFALQGPFVESPKDLPPIPLRVVRHFFLRIDSDGLRSSVDGKTFDWHPVQPGSFQIGLGASKDGPEATISIRTPTPPDLEPASAAH